MNPSNEQIQRRIAQGVNAWDREEYEEALKVFDDVLRSREGFPDVHNRRGLCLALLGRLDEALAAFERAVELAPTYAEAHLNRGIILKDLGRADAAQEAFDRAGRLDLRDGRAFPSHVGNQIAVTHAKLGDLYLVADHPETAAAQYRDALRVRPRYQDVRTKLAEALLEAGDLEGARAELERVLEDDPAFTSARLRLGVVFSRMGDAAGAAACWEQCARERPDDFRARAYLASLAPGGSGGSGRPDSPGSGEPELDRGGRDA
ncbi:MAG: tetratricopeptide repeat protein [Longimicrobiales bacterium]|nr:tetratricopeptide repeat protein [Longimicrobiales bacterium]